MFAMGYWTAVQVQPRRDRLALHFLELFGFETYAPRLRDRRIIRGRRVVQNPLLFPGYLFCLIELQWSQARFSPGVVRLVMDGVVPATVPDTVISSLKAREIGGLIELPKPPTTRRSRACAARSVRRARRAVCWHEAARSGRGAADVIGRFASCRARR